MGIWHKYVEKDALLTLVWPMQGGSRLYKLYKPAIKSHKQEQTTKCCAELLPRISRTRYIEMYLALPGKIAC